MVCKSRALQRARQSNTTWIRDFLEKLIVGDAVAKGCEPLSPSLGGHLIPSSVNKCGKSDLKASNLSGRVPGMAHPEAHECLCGSTALPSMRMHLCTKKCAVHHAGTTSKVLGPKSVLSLQK